MQIPVGLGLITLTLFLIAIVNLFTKPVATMAGGVFSVILYIVFTVSERRARNRGVAHVEMDQFNLELEGELSPEAVGARPGNILVPVSNHFNLYHLGNVLDRIKPGRRDVVVLHVRLLRRSASGENELDADQLFGSIEQHLFSQALSMAEKRGKSIRLAVVAANDLWDGILRAATAAAIQHYRYRALCEGHTEEQARQIGEAWEKLGDPKPQFNLEIHLPNGDKIYKVLGPHAPNLTANEVNLLHRLWLRFSESLAREELHHHDVVHFALEEVQKEIEEGHEDEVVDPFAKSFGSEPKQAQAQGLDASAGIGACFRPFANSPPATLLFSLISARPRVATCNGRSAWLGIGMVRAHCGHSLVVGAAGAAGLLVQ